MIEWCPWAIRRDGPADKQGYGSVTSTLKRGEIKHSMVGSFDAAMNVLDSTSRVSWHFSGKKDGLIFQHYGLSAVCWHGGTRANNERYIGVEHEGGGPTNFSEPLTEAQISSTSALTAWLAEQFGFMLYARYPDQIGAWELTEHREVHATACPSSRIPWQEVMRRLQEPEIEEDCMQIYTQPDGNRSFLVAGNVLIWIKSPAEYNALMARTPKPVDTRFDALSWGVVTRGCVFVGLA